MGLKVRTNSKYKIRLKIKTNKMRKIVVKLRNNQSPFKNKRIYIIGPSIKSSNNHLSNSEIL